MYEIVHLIVRDDDYLVPDAVIGSQMACHISEGLGFDASMLEVVDISLLTVDEYKIADCGYTLVADVIAITYGSGSHWQECLHSYGVEEFLYMNLTAIGNTHREPIYCFRVKHNWGTPPF